jgi:PPK2 family polyphosphate:nucleotide phosphotransferase
MTVPGATKKPLPRPSGVSTVTTDGRERLTISSTDSSFSGSSASAAASAVTGSSRGGGGGSAASAAGTVASAGFAVFRSEPVRQNAATPSAPTIGTPAIATSAVRLIAVTDSAAPETARGSGIGAGGCGRAPPQRQVSMLFGTWRAHPGHVHTKRVVTVCFFGASLVRPAVAATSAAHRRTRAGARRVARACKSCSNDGMTIDVSPFRVRENHRVDLKQWPTTVRPFYKSKEQYLELLAEHIDKLKEQQGLLYADDRYALLMILQAMDAAGKDGVIKHVMSGLNPQGCQVFSFKHPSAEELDHDFMWRAVRALPERGRIGIFNRSYYEEVLIVRVHPELLRAERIPDRSSKQDDEVWKRRYRSIVDFEHHLDRNGTRIVKVFLHVSKREQRKRFLARLDDPEKNWKFSAADLAERGYWRDYMKAYEKCLEETSTGRAPWYVVPADDKRNARLIVSAILVGLMRGLDLRYPVVDPAKQKELRSIRRRLLSE